MQSEKIFLSGVVQGVGCRYFSWKKAKSLGLCGWVKNLTDGRVEILVQGEVEIIDDFVHWLITGMKNAKITKLQRDKINDIQKYLDFEVRR